jgi:hypothetical protein
MSSAIINEEFLSQLEKIDMLVRNNVAGRFGGNRQSKSFGSSAEFADYRDYVPGDDTSKIDWNAYARFDKLYEKLYFDERQMHTRIYIDVSRSMGYGDSKKGICALRVAAAMAYLSVSGMDRVSVYTVSDSKVTEVISGIVGKDAYFTEIGKLESIEFAGECFISDAVMPEKVGYGDGMSVIISDFLTDANYEDAIGYLADKRRHVVCLQVLSGEEIDPTLRGKVHLFDSENANRTWRRNVDKEIANAYRAAVAYVTDRIARYCNSRGADYVLIKDTDTIGEIIFKKLLNMGVLK